VEVQRKGSAGRPAAVVVGLDCITGLQTARILAARGVPVIGLAANPEHFAARTNVCRRILRAPTDGEGLVPVLEALAGRLGRRAVLVPCSDGAVLELSLRRERLAAGYHLALPAHPVVEQLLHKPAMVRLAASLGMRVPACREVHDRADLERAIATLRFPVTLKPARKDERWTAHTTRKAFRAEGPDELVARFEACLGFSERFLVQEWIEGPESELFSCNCYFGREGEALVSFVARKVRQWPPETGTSSLGVACRAEAVRDETLRFFRRLDYRGLGYVEMKRDRRDGKFWLVEPNVGRPTGRSAIAEAAGVELLYTMYCDLAGLPLPEAREQTARPATWVYLRHDLQAAFVAWRRGQLSPREWWASLRGPRAFAVLSARDPLPFLFDLFKAARTALRGLRPRRRPRRASRRAPLRASR
jgi:predicted ATP-grasp superfamily ATP-dependent carboligase